MAHHPDSTATPPPPAPDPPPAYQAYPPIPYSDARIAETLRTGNNTHATRPYHRHDQGRLRDPDRDDGEVEPDDLPSSPVLEPVNKSATHHERRRSSHKKHVHRPSHKGPKLDPNDPSLIPPGSDARPLLYHTDHGGHVVIAHMPGHDQERGAPQYGSMYYYPPPTHHDCAICDVNEYGRQSWFERWCSLEDWGRIMVMIAVLAILGVVAMFSLRGP